MRKWVIGLVLALIALPAWTQTRDENAMKCGSGDPDACTALIQSGREATANLGIAYTHRGLAYSLKGRYDQAIADYSKAIELKPDYAEAYNLRASAYGKNGLLDQAIADETQAIALKPGFAPFYYNRGLAYRFKGLYDQAIADYGKAIAFRPDYAEAYNNRAWAYHEKGEDGKGLPDAENAVALMPNAHSIETRAEIYEKLGLRDKAIADYRRVLELEPDEAEARSGLERLGVAP